MLEQTFIHIPGVGYKTEQKLWGWGVKTWDDFLRRNAIVFSPDRDRFVSRELESSKKHRKDIRFFRDRLPSGEVWRLFGSFKEKAVYLDIETTGGYEGVNEITVIGLYDGRRVENFVSGINLEDFELAIEPYDVVVTFSGTTFDLPMIRRHFKHIFLPPCHIDLRFLMKRLGHRGGLKKIEKAFGIIRAPEIDGMGGYEAVQLWKAYQWGDEHSLEKLLQYNKADIVNLEPLTELAYSRLRAGCLRGDLDFTT